MRLPFLAGFLLAATFLFSQNTSNLQQPTSVNTDGAAPDASAQLDVQATDKGLLTPRLTTAQRTAIATPATGLLVYDTDTGSFWYYEDNTWNELAPATVPAESGVNTTGIPIPDNDPTGITSTITLTDPDTVATDTRFRVCLDITHNWTSDLDISLEAPDGTAIDLSSDNGGGANYSGTCFTTEATSPITGGSLPFTGIWQPEEPFTNFVGKTIAGDWKLVVVDDVGGDTGQLNHWSLQLSRPSATATLLDDADGDTRVTVEDLPDEDIVRLEAGGGTARLEVRPHSAVFSGLLRVRGSFVGGGRFNTASGSLSFVGGGESNTASGSRSFVGGGLDNTALESSSFVGGGESNTASGSLSFIGGGESNTASGLRSFVGGAANTASGSTSFVGGGQSNTASGSRSFIGGGLNNNVASRSQATFGEYSENLGGNTNIWVSTDPLFVIGNGTSENDRSNAMTVLKNGKVGIGTGIPGASLEVKGINGEDMALNVKSDIGTSRFEVRNDGHVGVNHTYSDVAFTVRGLGGEPYALNVVNSALNSRFVVRNNGEIGIGTVTPQYGVHISKAPTGLAINSGFGTGLLLTGAAAQPRIYFEHTLSSTDQRVMMMNFQDGRFSWKSTADDGLSFVQDNILVLETTGNVGIGLGDPSAVLHLKSTPSGNAPFRVDIDNTEVFLIENFTGHVGLGISPSHPLHLVSGARCTAAGTWTNSSDRRLKTDIANLGYGLGEIMALRPVSYRMKKSDEQQIGFIAQEVQKLLPELISGREGDIEEGETLGMSYGNLTAVLVKAVQEQQEIIEDLRVENREQRAEIARLSNTQEELQTQLSEMGELKSRMARLEAALSPPAEAMGED